jgi:hypothetical protein
MSSTSGFRGRLLLQAAVTALLAMGGGTVSSSWTIPTLVVAAAAVFVGLAMRAEPAWRWYTVGFEGFAIAFGLVAVVSGHYVPGTLIAGWTLYYLLSPAGAGAFAGVPSWVPAVPAPAYAPAGAVPEQAWAPPVPALAYAQPAASVLPPPPLAPPSLVPQQVTAAGYAPAPDAAPVAPPAVEAPAAPAPPAPLPSRPAAMTVLPGR